MGRLVKFLNEATEEEVLEILKRDCKPYIKELKKFKEGKQLWRGTYNKVGDIRKFRARKNRQPLHTWEGLHNAMDRIAKKVVGFPLRSQGVFTTTSEYTSCIFGQPYPFYPIGNFTAFWLEDIADSRYLTPPWMERAFEDLVAIDDVYPLFKSWYNLSSLEWPYKNVKPIEETDNEKILKRLREEGEKILVDIMKKYKKDNLKNAFKTPEGVEVIVKCKEYYLISYHYKEIHEKLRKNLK